MEELMRARRSRSAAGWVLMTTLALVLTGCAIGGDDGTIPQNALNPAGPVARSQDALWDRVFPIAITVFVLVQGLIIYAVIRFRSKGGDEDLPKQVAGNTRLEIGWTIVPALILAGIAIPTVSTIFSLATVGEDPINVRVVGKQYWWEFEYEDPQYEGVVTATQLVIPEGREIQLDMQSVSAQQPYDPAAVPEGTVNPSGSVALGVIHSFWVPQLAGKMDVVPGHTREMKIEADEPGLYLGQCAEFCGLSHPNMRFSVLATTAEEFDEWIAAQAEPAEVVEEGLAAQGQELFLERQCLTCHTVDGHPDNLDLRIGPDLTHWNSREEFAGGILDVQSDDDITAWLRDPQAEKPGTQMTNLNLSDADIEALVAYLRTLD